ncbi:protein phosphatase 5 [Angomonas deanei]|uniref:Calcineurin-like phosphoesterase, putative n=1 Tax=Angomonas deanei TaxID=59799 RepID=A0A7G2CSP1_9TRYP|nr:protein phosphatase 5 [Angomonas deanei]CAD2222227.1 Calcineurin-like phosphoesterase, putative [Angomonas deanei]|eukprot:EPY36145.1 protein phosphatase 5 [Angomonas deanei]
MLLSILKLFKSLPNFVDITVPDDEDITVCGDTHGQFYDLMNIFKMNGNPSPTNRYLFNGDFVDRGSYSFENVMTLFAYKLLYPQHVFLSRGNHEGLPMNRVYGFEGEVRAKYSSELFGLFSEVFNALPTGHIINKKIFVVHGGLYSRDDVTIADLQKPNRFKEIPENGVLCESLWADPQPMPGRTPSKRGVDCPEFGPDVTETFLKNNDLKLVVRSHEAKQEGYEVTHNGKCITVFSAPNYCDQMGNKGAFIRFNGKQLEPRYTSFTHVPHPGKRAMYYASGLGMI